MENQFKRKLLKLVCTKNIEELKLHRQQNPEFFTYTSSSSNPHFSWIVDSLKLLSSSSSSDQDNIFQELLSLVDNSVIEHCAFELFEWWFNTNVRVYTQIHPMDKEEDIDTDTDVDTDVDEDEDSLPQLDLNLLKLLLQFDSFQEFFLSKEGILFYLDKISLHHPQIRFSTSIGTQEYVGQKLCFLLMSQTLMDMVRDNEDRMSLFCLQLANIEYVLNTYSPDYGDPTGKTWRWWYTTHHRICPVCKTYKSISSLSVVPVLYPQIVNDVYP
jgi:hypothetical protein